MDLNNGNLSSKEIRKIILNSQEPLRIKNLMKCDLLSWTLKNWEEILKDELLKFRCGKYHYTTNPQWETTCSNNDATFNDFLVHIDSGLQEWWYFDYKYLCEWFTDNEILKKKIDWSALGFPELTANDSTIWIGSKGAHTSCHKDTYGCNLILQVYGRKQWILFPPEHNLKPTRIPYEESSIYSKLNFFSPREEDFRGIRQCHKIILNPGDVLVLPHKWWHYVENLETAISINVWLPLPQDNLERVKESIASVFAGQMAKSQNDCKNIILNPNMIEEMVSCEQALDIIDKIIPKYKPANKVLKVSNPAIKTRENNDEVDQFITKCKFISKIPILSENEFKLFLRNQLQRFSVIEKCEEDTETLSCKKVIDFLNVITDDDVLSLIANKLMEKR